MKNESTNIHATSKFNLAASELVLNLTQKTSFASKQVDVLVWFSLKMISIKKCGVWQNSLSKLKKNIWTCKGAMFIHVKPMEKQSNFLSLLFFWGNNIITRRQKGKQNINVGLEVQYFFHTRWQWIQRSRTELFLVSIGFYMTLLSPKYTKGQHQFSPQKEKKVHDTSCQKEVHDSPINPCSQILVHRYLSYEMVKMQNHASCKP